MITVQGKKVNHKINTMSIDMKGIADARHSGGTLTVSFSELDLMPVLEPLILDEFKKDKRFSHCEVIPEITYVHVSKKPNSDECSVLGRLCIGRGDYIEYVVHIPIDISLQAGV